MQETSREDIPATLAESFHKEQDVLRNKLLLFRLRNYNLIKLQESISLDLDGIEPRLSKLVLALSLCLQESLMFIRLSDVYQKPPTGVDRTKSVNTFWSGSGEALFSDGVCY